MTGWGEQLDRFQAHLDDQRRAVAEGRPGDLDAFEPQAVGPLPAELADRARDLCEQADAFTRELVAATASAARQLQLLSVMSTSEQPPSTYVDHRG